MRPIMRWHVDQTSTKLRRVACRNTPVMMHLILLKHDVVHPTPYTWPLTASCWGPTLNRDSYSHTRLYKGDLASPLRYDSLSHTFLHTYLISHTDFIVRVLTCMQTPFVPAWDCITTAPEHCVITFSTIRSHRTYHLALEGGDRSLNCHSPTILHHNRFLLRDPPP